MLVTTDEALTKWCPHLQVFAPGPGGYPMNRWTSDNPTGLNHMIDDKGFCCIADKCMQWRWAYKHNEAVMQDPNVIYKGEPQGYCGLAGRPEE